jgi:hypothetical protein
MGLIPSTTKKPEPKPKPNKQTKKTKQVNILSITQLMG